MVFKIKKQNYFSIFLAGWSSTAKHGQKSFAPFISNSSLLYYNRDYLPFVDLRLMND